MVFASPVFLFLFLPLTLALYWLARTTDARNMVLLAMSLLEGSLFHVYPVAMVAAFLAIVAASAGHRHYTQAR